MPNCFSLTRKSDIGAGPVSLAQIDNEICQHLGVVPAPDKYYANWFDTIGLMLALGECFDGIIKECHTNMSEYPESASYYETKLKIAEYLNQHFVSDAWAEAGKAR